jgi:hypothetical protein
VTDENPRTFWVAAQNRPGEWLTIDLERPYDIRAVQVNYADYRSNLYATDSTVYAQFRLQASLDGQRWVPIGDLTGERRDRPNAYIEMPGPARARFIRYEHVYVAAAHLAISDIRVFGTGSGRPPGTPSGLSVRRDADRRNAFVAWKPVPAATGYNVLWGIAPDKLYQTYQVFADGPDPLEIRALTADQDYCFAIEAFNENGVSPVSRIVHLP